MDKKSSTKHYPQTFQVDPNEILKLWNQGSQLYLRILYNELTNPDCSKEDLKDFVSELQTLRNQITDRSVSEYGLEPDLLEEVKLATRFIDSFMHRYHGTQNTDDFEECRSSQLLEVQSFIKNLKYQSNESKEKLKEQFQEVYKSAQAPEVAIQVDINYNQKLIDYGLNNNYGSNYYSNEFGFAQEKQKIDDCQEEQTPKINIHFQEDVKENDLKWNFQEKLNFQSQTSEQLLKSQEPLSLQFSFNDQVDIPIAREEQNMEETNNQSYGDPNEFLNLWIEDTELTYRLLYVEMLKNDCTKESIKGVVHQLKEQSKKITERLTSQEEIDTKILEQVYLIKIDIDIFEWYYQQTENSNKFQDYRKFCLLYSVFVHVNLKQLSNQECQQIKNLQSEQQEACITNEIDDDEKQVILELLNNQSELKNSCYNYKNPLSYVFQENPQIDDVGDSEKAKEQLIIQSSNNDFQVICEQQPIDAPQYNFQDLIVFPQVTKVDPDEMLKSWNKQIQLYLDLLHEELQKKDCIKDGIKDFVYELQILRNQITDGLISQEGINSEILDQVLNATIFIDTFQILYQDIKKANQFQEFKKSQLYELELFSFIKKSQNQQKQEQQQVQKQEQKAEQKQEQKQAQKQEQEQKQMLSQRQQCDRNEVLKQLIEETESKLQLIYLEMNKNECTKESIRDLVQALNTQSNKITQCLTSTERMNSNILEEVLVTKVNIDTYQWDYQQIGNADEFEDYRKFCLLISAFSGVNPKKLSNQEYKELQQLKLNQVFKKVKKFEEKQVILEFQNHQIEILKQQYCLTNIFQFDNGPEQQPEQEDDRVEQKIKLLKY